MTVDLDLRCLPASEKSEKLKEDGMRTIMAALMVTTFATCASAQDPDGNLQLALKAAREMSFYSEDNRPYLLVKLGVIRSPIALVFGYADNEDGCAEIAEDYNRAVAERASGTPAQFECDAVY